MSENNLELIRMIQEANDPQAAMAAAVAVIGAYLLRHGSSAEPLADPLREPTGKAG